MAFVLTFISLAIDCADALSVTRLNARQDTSLINSKPVALNEYTASLQSPVSWFHVPRCASSFQFNLLSLVPDLCNDRSFWSDPSSIPTAGQVRKACPGISLAEDSHCDSDKEFAYCAEFTTGIISRQSNVKVMGIFRQPEQRMISDWYWLTSLGWELEKSISGNGTIADYARIHRGCAMRMLIDEAYVYPIGAGVHCGEIAPSFKAEERMDEALEVLEKFSFVGLLEEWELSMCLFNKMFGTPCRPEQVWDLTSHQNWTKKGDKYDTSILNGWVDDIDGPVYNRAQQIYTKSLKRYDASEDTCASCFVEMGIKNNA